jgi:hypothetical protein
MQFRNFLKNVGPQLQFRNSAIPQFGAMTTRPRFMRPRSIGPRSIGPRSIGPIG